jgi:hypothetical protein
MQVRFKEEELQEPITIEEAKEYTHITHKADDRLISIYIKAARAYCEKITGYSLVNKTVIIQSDIPSERMSDKGFEDLPHAIIDPNNISHRYKLPYGPVSEVTEVKLVKLDGEFIVLENTLYSLDADFDLLYWRFDTFNLNINDYDYVKIKYKTSWGGEEMPSDIKEAMLELISDMYYNKGNAENNYPKIHTKLSNYQIQRMYEAL